MQASEFLKLFPAVERDVCTGGNCTAWHTRLADGSEVLITESASGHQPALDDKRIDIGRIDSRGTQVALECAVTWGQAARALRAWMRNAGKYACQQIVLRETIPGVGSIGECIYAITHGVEIVRGLRDCRNSSEAARAFREFMAGK